MMPMTAPLPPTARPLSRVLSTVILKPRAGLACTPDLITRHAERERAREDFEFHLAAPLPALDEYGLPQGVLDRFTRLLRTWLLRTAMIALCTGLLAGYITGQRTSGAAIERAYQQGRTAGVKQRQPLAINIDSPIR